MTSKRGLGIKDTSTYGQMRQKEASLSLNNKSSNSWCNEPRMVVITIGERRTMLDMVDYDSLNAHKNVVINFFLADASVTAPAEKI